MSAQAVVATAPPAFPDARDSAPRRFVFDADPIAGGVRLLLTFDERVESVEIGLDVARAMLDALERAVGSAATRTARRTIATEGGRR